MHGGERGDLASEDHTQFAAAMLAGGKAGSTISSTTNHVEKATCGKKNKNRSPHLEVDWQSEAPTERLTFLRHARAAVGASGVRPTLRSSAS